MFLEYNYTKYNLRYNHIFIKLLQVFEMKVEIFKMYIYKTINFGNIFKKIYITLYLNHTKTNTYEYIIF